MASLINFNLGTNEGFVIFLSSKLITCIFSGFTLRIKSQSIVYLLNGSEHIYWILELEDEVQSIWGLWTCGLQECKGKCFFLKSGKVGNIFQVGQTNSSVIQPYCGPQP